MPSTFRQLQADWAWLRRQPEARAALQSWASDPPLADARTLDDLLARCRVRAHYVRPHPNAPDPAAFDPDVVLGALVRRAPIDAVAARTALQALVCGVARLVRTAAAGIDDAPADLLALTWERIVAYPYVQRPRHVAANILLDVRKDYWRQLATARRVQPRGLVVIDPNSPAPEGDSTEDSMATAGVDVRLLLADAVARSRLTPRGADMIWRSRVADEDDGALAVRHGTSRHTARQYRRRAEIRLATLLRAS